MLTLAGNGDDAALQRLFERYLSPLKRWAPNLCDTDDLVRESLDVERVVPHWEHFALLDRLGRLQGLIAEAQLAQRLDPLNPARHVVSGRQSEAQALMPDIEMDDRVGRPTPAQSAFAAAGLRCGRPTD